MKHLILKFGGSSLANTAGLKRVVHIARERLQHHTLTLVVSATAGTTDKLLHISQLARQEAPAALEAWHSLIGHHLRIGGELLTPELQRQLEQRYNDLDAVIRPHLQCLGHNNASAFDADAVLAAGEKLSGLLVAAALTAAGIDSDFERAEQFIVTDSTAGSAKVDLQATGQRFAQHTAAYWRARVRAVAGFSGADAQGRTTLLGRNASDYSAALVARFVGDELEIYSDVCAYSADPRLVTDAQRIPQLSVTDAVALAGTGARVLHPRTFEPLRDTQVPVRLLSSFDPHAPGTLITQTVRGRRHGFLSVCENTPDANVYSKQYLVLPPPLQRLLDKHPNSALITVFPSSDRPLVSWRVQLQTALHNAGIVITDSDLLPQEQALIIAVQRDDLNFAAQTLHGAINQRSRTIKLAVIGGTGRIGAEVLQLLHRNREHLRNEAGIEFELHALCNSKRVLTSLTPLHIETASAYLDTAAESAQPAHAVVDFLLQIPHGPAIVIDCSASSDVAQLYEKLLLNGIAVVTPNKIANSRSARQFEALAKLAGQQGVPYLYETTVGAALPILRTLLDLRRAGDHVVELKATLSGTIGYVLDRIQQDIPFSVAVKEAVEKGYAEPNPFLDLCGEDVARKLLILLRTAGVAVEREQLKLEPLEAEQPGVEIDEVLRSADAPWRVRVAEARARGHRLAYIASYDEESGMKVGLHSVGPESPFFRLRATENCLLLRSGLYEDIPLTVSGPGAGIAITSAGVFADVLAAARELTARHGSNDALAA